MNPLMGGPVTALTGRPAYRQIADDLRARISDGRYGPGSQLPSTAKLMSEYGASSTVARRAVEVLRAEGLLTGQPGKGVFVADDASVAAIDDAATLARRLDDALARIQQLEERVATLEKKLERPRNLRPVK